MISFEDFVSQEGSPIYVQIIRHIKRGIVSGEIVDGDEVPSRRFLSALLGVNPNTIQKAFALLEEEGLMESRTGAKSTVCLPEGAVEALRREQVERYLRETVRSLRQMGLSRAEALSLLEQGWDTEEKEEEK